MGVIKRISGEELRNDYFLEVRAMGTFCKNINACNVDKVVFTLTATGGIDKHLHGEDVLQIAYEVGCDRVVWAWGQQESDELDISALLTHFSAHPDEYWFEEAKTLGHEWANGDSYDFSAVDTRGLLIYGADLQEIDE